ncbi:MAG TPA: exodeoxyribonuclease VII small subunit [Bacteroidales bacterium]|nr:exodeoxyribonuclease VII small subunit [Bacteroidales bacterium]
MNKMNYTEAFTELQQLVKQMEQADVSVDELAQKIERAGKLIQICKDKLVKTEEEIAKIAEQFE